MKPDGGMSRLAADGLLLITACLWGVTFVAQKDAVGVLPPLAFVAARFGVSALVLAPLALLERRAVQRKASPGAMRLALAIGLSLFLGTTLQQAGLETTSATNGGFLTACYVVLTPFVVWTLSGPGPAPSCLPRAQSRYSARGFSPPAAGRLGRRRSATGSCSRRRRLGDRHRADPAVPHPRGEAADACFHPICDLRRARWPDFRRVRVGRAACVRRRRARDPVRRPRLRRGRLYAADLRPALHAAGRSGADPVAGERVRGARGGDLARRTALRRSALSAASDPSRRGRGRGGAGARAIGGPSSAGPARPSEAPHGCAVGRRAALRPRGRFATPGSACFAALLLAPIVNFGALAGAAATAAVGGFADPFRRTPSG